MRAKLERLSAAVRRYSHMTPRRFGILDFLIVMLFLTLVVWGIVEAITK